MSLTTIHKVDIRCDASMSCQYVTPNIVRSSRRRLSFDPLLMMLDQKPAAISNAKPCKPLTSNKALSLHDLPGRRYISSACKCWNAMIEHVYSWAYTCHYHDMFQATCTTQQTPLHSDELHILQISATQSVLSCCIGESWALWTGLHALKAVWQWQLNRNRNPNNRKWPDIAARHWSKNKSAWNANMAQSLSNAVPLLVKWFLKSCAPGAASKTFLCTKLEVNRSAAFTRCCCAQHVGKIKSI